MYKPSQFLVKLNNFGAPKKFNPSHSTKQVIVFLCEVLFTMRLP